MRDIREFEPLWGEWRSVRLLGQGSYGKVYLAEKVELGKHYYSAIKYIPIPTPIRPKSCTARGWSTTRPPFRATMNRCSAP